MSVALSLAVIGLEQFLRTPFARYEAQPGIQVEHWITGSLMAVPFFVAGTWAADRIAGWAKLGTASYLDLLKRSLLIALLSGLALTPAWFVINRTDNPVGAQPLVFPNAHDSGDVYSVAPGVIVALVCACLVPAAFWAGRAIAGAITCAALAPARAAVTRAVVPAMLAAAVPVLAWLMYQAAGHAYATQVYYPRAPLGAQRRIRPAPLPATASRLTAAPHLEQAPDALVSQAAHALQDGLAGQAAGIPVTAVTAAVLLRVKTAKSHGKPAHTDLAA